MRRLKDLIAKASSTTDVYKAIGEELAELYDSFKKQGHIQVEATFNPIGFKVHFPKEEDNEG